MKTNIVSKKSNPAGDKLKIEPVKKLLLIDLIIDRIGRLIAEGVLKPGSSLPSEKHLAESLDVSITSVRQALKALSVLGILEITPGSKTYLKESMSRVLINPIKFIVLLHNIEFYELFETRKIIECSLIRFTTDNITDADIIRLKEIIIKSEQDIDDSKKFVQYNMDFHQLINNASGLNILPAFMESIRNLIIATGEKTSVRISDPKLCIEQHKKIYEAIKEKDKDKAAIEMWNHIDSVESKLKQYGDL